MKDLIVVMFLIIGGMLFVMGLIKRFFRMCLIGVVIACSIMAIQPKVMEKIKTNIEILIEETLDFFVDDNEECIVKEEG